MVFDRKEWNKNYYKSKKGIKSARLCQWKKHGLIAINYDIIFDRWWYSSHCENCKCEYSKDNVKCMDHDHDTGLFRNILCNRCNSNLNIRNSSGIPNIYWRNDRNSWEYKRKIKGITYSKTHKNLNLIKNHKTDIENKLIYMLI